MLAYPLTGEVAVYLLLVAGATAAVMVACTCSPAFSRLALRQTSPRVAAPAICNLCSSARGWQLRFFPTLNPFVTQLLVSASVPPRFSHLLRHTYASMARDGLPCQAEDPLRHTIDLAGESVQVVAAPGLSDTDFRIAIDSSLFKQWLKNMQSQKGILADEDFSLRQVLIQGVDMFGRRVGFLKFKAEIVDKETGKKVPGIVFSRGEAVAVLILLESEGNTFVVLTEQARVPVGRFVLELPAGMLDDDHGDVIGTAVREVEEETGICLNLEDMVNLTAFLHPSTGCKVFPSPGGCDEEISLFLYRGHVEKEVIEALQGKQTGLREHGELIKVHVVPYDKLWCMTADAKVLTAMALYENTKREGLLPPRNLPDIPAL